MSEKTITIAAAAALAVYIAWYMVKNPAKAVSVRSPQPTPQEKYVIPKDFGILDPTTWD